MLMVKWNNALGVLGGTLILMVLVLSVPVVAAGVMGTPHDFRAPQNGGGNTKYPHLAQVAGSSPCQACHVSHGAQAPFLLPTDYGWKPQKGEEKLSLLTHFCLGCHDGVIETSYGQDQMAGHNLQNHPHKVETVWKGKAPQSRPGGGVVKRGELKTKKGQALPVYLLPESSSYTVTCLTCHNPHQNNETAFLRASKDDLCTACHE